MSTELSKAQSTALANKPDFLKVGDTRGTEQLTSADIRPPALRLAQALTPETKRHESVYIDGLREGEIFNSVTKRNYGEGPVKFLIVSSLGHRHVEFAPMSEGGGVIDFNVPDNDERTKFREEMRDGKKVRLRPIATKFYDYLILVLEDDGNNQLCTLSLKGTQLKKAVTLNTLIKGLKMPSFALVIGATVVAEKRGTYNYYGWKFEPAGWPTEDQFNDASERYNKTIGKGVAVDLKEETAREAKDSDDDIPF